MNNGCKGYFPRPISEQISHEFGFLKPIYFKVKFCFLNKLEHYMKFTSLQPSVTVAMRKISLSTVTHGCKAALIVEIRLTFDNQDIPMNLGKKSQLFLNF